MHLVVVCGCCCLSSIITDRWWGLSFISVGSSNCLWLIIVLKSIPVSLWSGIWNWYNVLTINWPTILVQMTIVIAFSLTNVRINMIPSWWCSCPFPAGERWLTGKWVGIFYWLAQLSSSSFRRLAGAQIEVMGRVLVVRTIGRLLIKSSSVNNEIALWLGYRRFNLVEVTSTELEVNGIVICIVFETDWSVVNSPPLFWTSEVNGQVISPQLLSIGRNTARIISYCQQLLLLTRETKQILNHNKKAYRE